MWNYAMLAVLAFSAALQAGRGTSGSVAGVVLDGEGRPLAEATVFIGTLANSPRAVTDADGRFKLDSVPAGLVGLNAFKESAGYPYDMFSFYLMPGARLPKFELAEGETRPNVIIQLGAKAAYLRLYVTTQNGLPIDTSLSFSRPDLGRYGDYQRGAKSGDVIPVPPVPFRLTVSAHGFRIWHYGAEDGRASDALISLKSGQVKTIAVTLER